MDIGNRERFEIRVSEAELEDLRERLRRTRWLEPIEGGAYEGLSLETLRSLADYWADGFDWRAQERRLNVLDHRVVDVDGLRIHLVHYQPEGSSSIPIVLSHGWPGSFLELLGLAERLAEPAAWGADPDDAFEVIVPSLPGYGFSERPRRPGMSAAAIAELWCGLMDRLGHARFALHGGDWGAGVSSWLARRHPERVIGLHLNYIDSYRPGDVANLSAEERAFLEEDARWCARDGAYSHAQATRPLTVSHGLNDSPAALLAWIVEKFQEWSDCGGDVLSRFSRDWLLTNVTLYWVTQTIASANRLYAESSHQPMHLEAGERIAPACGIAHFPLEAPFPPRAWIERGYSVTHWTEMPRGGHFAALEEPELLAEDIRAFFRPMRGALAG